MKKICSLNNPQIKRLKKLKSKKYRQEFKLFFVENLVIISDALKSGYDFESLFITADFAQKNREALKFLQENSKAENFFEIDLIINKSFSSLETPSGIVAIYKSREARECKKEKNSRSVYLNGINDPGNLGTIMRTALAFGFKTFVLDETCADIYNPKTISAAKDSIFKLNFIFDNNRAWLEKEIVGNKISLYVADAQGGLDLNSLKADKSFCLAFGSESQGLSKELLNLANKRIKIDISSEIESLNVAIAAGIFFYKLGN